MIQTDNLTKTSNRSQALHTHIINDSCNMASKKDIPELPTLLTWKLGCYIASLVLKKQFTEFNDTGVIRRLTELDLVLDASGQSIEK